MSDPGETVPSDPGAGGAADEAFCSACNQSYAVTVQFCPQDGARLVRFRGDTDALIGRVIDERFEVQAQIGRGGMGTVYSAWQRSVDREVAIKVVDARLSTDRIAAKRFLREARLASRLSHPAIVVVYDFGQTDDGVLYLVMELLRGRTLAAELGGKPFTARRTIRVAIQLCDALEAAHRQDIVHRDLKPQNIVILTEPPGRDLVKVLDFGLAKSLVHDESAVTRSDAIIGTPLYMAPETIQARGADARSDLYSLGCLIHEMLSGRPPFLDESPNMVLAKHLSEPPPALDPVVPEPLRALVAALLAKEPAARPASATAVRDRLAAMADGGGSHLDARAAAGDVTSSAAFADTMAGGPQDRTREAATREAATREAQTRIAFTPPRPRRWPAIAVAFLGLAACAALALFYLRDRAPAATPPATDARVTPAITVDAAVAPADAAPAPPLDAAAALPADAGTRRERDRDRPRPDAAIPTTSPPPPPPSPPDAAPRKTDLDFILPGATPP